MSPVTVSRQDDVVHVTLDQPERANALSLVLVEALIDAVDQAIDEGARMLVFAGNGRCLCGGFDLSDLDAETDESLAWRFLRIEHLLQLIHYAPCPTVALAHGNVSGAGADLFAACTRRIASPEAVFRFPGARFGVVLGTGRLLRLVGGQARGLILTQRRIDAQQALTMGLADTIAQSDAWPDEVTRIARGALQVGRDTVRRINELSLSEADRDLGALARSIATPGMKHRMQNYWLEVTTSARKDTRAVAASGSG
jgi:enoyl-CoA hydratase